MIRNFAFFGMVGFALLEVLFIVGEYSADPGGVQAVIGSIGVIGTITGISVWAWFSPRTAQYYLWVTVGVIVAIAVWWAIAPRLVMDVMDERGPLVPVAAIIAAVPIVFWGMREWAFITRAGIALLIVAIAPMLGVAMSPKDMDRGVLTAVAIMLGPYAIGGLLYVLSGRLRERTTIPTTEDSMRVAPSSTPTTSR